MATMLLFSDAVSSAYKDTSKALKEVDLNEKRVVKKTLSQMMKQSFFHGANRFGTNFIAWKTIIVGILGKTRKTY